MLSVVKSGLTNPPHNSDRGRKYGRDEPKPLNPPWILRSVSEIILLVGKVSDYLDLVVKVVLLDYLIITLTTTRIHILLTLRTMSSQQQLKVTRRQQSSREAGTATSFFGSNYSKQNIVWSQTGAMKTLYQCNAYLALPSLPKPDLC